VGFQREGGIVEMFHESETKTRKRHIASSNIKKKVNLEEWRTHDIDIVSTHLTTRSILPSNIKKRVELEVKKGEHTIFYLPIQRQDQFSSNIKKKVELKT